MLQILFCIRERYKKKKKQINWVNQFFADVNARRFYNLTEVNYSKKIRYFGPRINLT